MLDMVAVRQAGTEAARKAGKYLRDNYGLVEKIDYKSTDINLVTEFDRASERMITTMLHSAFPDHGFIAEEGTQLPENTPSEARYRWLIDPLDGTTNYAHAYPMYAVSIGLADGDQMIFGTVYAPMLDELFVAERGGGATLNGRAIHVSQTKELIRALLVTGFPYDLKADPEVLQHWNNFVVRAQAVRRDGTAAIDLAYTAAGRFDAFWEHYLAPWDVGAGSLIVSEAGGTVTGVYGQPFTPFLGNVLASNGDLHQPMLETLGLIDKSRQQEYGAT